MLPLPWLPPGVWHRSQSCTLALHGGEHPAPTHQTASECRCCTYLFYRRDIYTEFMQLRHKTRNSDCSSLVLEYDWVTSLYLYCFKTANGRSELRRCSARGLKLMSQIKSQWGTSIRFEANLSRSWRGEWHKVENLMLQSTAFIFGAIGCFILKNKALRCLETSGNTDHST